MATDSELARILLEVVDALWQPAFLVSCDSGEVCHVNARARQTFDSPPPWLAACACGAPGSPPDWVRTVHVNLPGEPAVELVLPAIHRIHPDESAQAPWAKRWRLPPRLARIAACMLRGRADKEIAAMLGLEVQTVRTYVKQLYQRAGLHSRADLFRAVYGGELGPRD